MKLKVVFSIDPTGFDPDIVEIITIRNGVCLFCNHDQRLKNHAINRVFKEVRSELTRIGYDLRYHFNLLKVYTC